MSDPDQRFRVISLAFLAQCVPQPEKQEQELAPCGDGYPLRGLSDPQRRNLVGLDYPGVTIDFVTPGTEQYA
ncbi:hypothetical protein, partial [Leifsonia sp. SIMBA_070]|uniref:hypothetical protein n=1 Tax=Leifsonia sp. SIMBA_070 TaxID=3085810 RepID=UPI003979335C